MDETSPKAAGPKRAKSSKPPRSRPLKASPSPADAAVPAPEPTAPALPAAQTESLPPHSGTEDAAATSPAAPALTPDQSAALLDGSRALPPRRRHRAGAEGASSSPSSPDVEILALTSRLQELVVGRREEDPQRGGTAPPPPASARLRPRGARTAAAPAEEAITVLAEAPAAPPASPTLPVTPSAASVPPTPLMTPQAPPPPPILPTMVRRGMGERSAEERLQAVTARWGRLGLQLGALALLLAVTFGLGRCTAPAGPRSRQPSEQMAAEKPAVSPASAPAPAPLRWTPPTAARLEEALKILRGGDLGKTLDVLRTLRDSEGSLPGLELLIGDLNLRAGRSQDATRGLLPLFRADPPVAAACDQLGFLSARGRRLEEAAGYFQAAATADPISGLYFHQWGEALRRQGKLDEAIPCFEQALLRRSLRGGARPAPAAVALRLNLARVETGLGVVVGRESEELLKQLPPNTPEFGQVLITLAAAELQDGRLPSAAARLKQAREVLATVRSPGGAPEFDVLLNDYFFRAYAGRPELADVIPATASPLDVRRVAPLTGSAEVYFIDP